MKTILNNNWKCTSDNLNTELSALLVNETDTYVEWEHEQKIRVTKKEDVNLTVVFEGYKCVQGGGCLYINGYPVPFGAKVSMPLCPPVDLNIKIKILANSVIEMKNLILETSETETDLTEELCEKTDVLVISPDYPSTHNLYLCAFAHSRVREYINAGLKVQVAAISGNWYQTIYDINGVNVFNGNYKDLKKILEKRICKVIVTHFVSEEHYQIFDGYIRDEKLIFICHGPETIFEELPDKVKPYFTKPLRNNDLKYLYREKREYVKKYAKKENVTWVFVSQWLKEKSEQVLELRFENSRVINNTINETLFPYFPKKAEGRKKVLILRKFDNVCQHSIDQCVLAIRELSRRGFFDELEFNIYGDGNFFDELLEPVKEFHNVHIHRGFIPNEKISEVYAQNGILLIPSRHDAHAVSMGEAAATGMAVVGSRVTSNPFFMNEEENHTLADPENPVELADIIERLFRNPEEFLQISKRMSEETLARCCVNNTVKKEVDLIQEKMLEQTEFKKVEVVENPVLTIVVPAFNIEKYVDKCLFSLTNHSANDKLEILFINDGSKDDTLTKAKAFVEKYKKHNIIIVDKDNGGHGSTINKGLELAKGKYFRLIDGDDWVDSKNLEKQIELLASMNVDLMLTKGCYEYIERDRLENIIDYDSLHEGTVYNFEDLTYENYGFSDYGPLLTTATYKTDVLRKANFRISEKKPYVDMEFNAFSLRYINTVTFYDLDIYRYLIGREGQTVSRDFWKKKYMVHKEILFNLCEYLKNIEDLSVRKQKYIADKLIARMVDSQIFMYDQLTRWEELDDFLRELKAYGLLYEVCIDYVKGKKHDSYNILNYYKLAMKKNKYTSIDERVPIINPDSSINYKCLKELNVTGSIKQIAKWVVPYEIVVRMSRKNKKSKI